MNEAPTNPYSDLCNLMRDLSDGMLREPVSVFRDIPDTLLKGGAPDGTMKGLLTDYVGMLGQLARQMQAVTLPEFIHAFTDFTHLDWHDATKAKSELRKILGRVDRAAQTLQTEICFRMPNEPRLNYPPHPEFMPDESVPTFGQLLTALAEQTRLLERYVHAFHADRPLGKDESQPLDTRTLADFLTAKLCKDQSDDGPETGDDDAEKDFALSVERLEALKSTVRTLLAEAVAYARRHGSVHLSACCDLERELKVGSVHHDFTTRLKQALDDLWQEAMSRGKGSGNGAGRKKSPVRTDQVKGGVAKKRRNPSRSNMSIARDILMNWAGVHGKESAERGYPNDGRGFKLLAGEIKCFLDKNG